MTESAPVRPDTSDMAPVHKVFRLSLASGPEFVGSAAGDNERGALIANYYANLMAFLKVHHDGEEEIVFRLLMERAPEHKAVVEEAMRQHDDVVGLMLAVNESVEAWEAKGDSVASELLRSLRALEDVFDPAPRPRGGRGRPPGRRYLTVEEWGSLAGHAMGNFKGDKIWLIMGLIRENFTQEQRDAMLEHMPPPLARCGRTWVRRRSRVDRSSASDHLNAHRRRSICEACLPQSSMA